MLVESYIWRDDSTGRAFLEDLAQRRHAASRCEWWPTPWARPAPAGVLAGHGAPRHRRPPVPSALPPPLVPALPGPPQDPGGRPRGRVHRRHEHRRGVRLGSGRGRRARPGATPTCGRAARSPGRWRWSSARAGTGRAARRFRSLRWTRRASARRAPGCWCSTPGRGADTRRRPPCWRRSSVARARRVWVTNAYFAPRPPAVEILGRAVDRGFDVRLLLPGRTDVPWCATPATGTSRPARPGRADLRVWGGDPPRQVPGGRRRGGGRRLHQPRLPLVPLQCRVQPGDLRPAGGDPARGDLRG